MTIKTEIASHRGGALVWPENSPTAFRNTAKLAVEQVEFDVHPTTDGRLAVFHDPVLERTSDGTGPIGAKSWAELQQITLKGTDGERMLALEDVVGIFRGTPVKLRLEIKPDHDRRPYPQTPAMVAAVLKAEGALADTTVTSFQVETLVALRRHVDPKGTIWILSNYVMTDVGIAGAIATARLHGVPALSVHRTMLTADVVKAARDAGLGIGGFAVNEEEDIRRMFALEVDVFTTDRPDRALAIRDSLR
ncbi:glycerophosphoryl diester phosphodiesterase [Stella humosa]|uniref:Glycerophosphoryl diester phosphodiesterase n=1 Tax=Stella humosa TaxID=94 RepID=A0A3N1L0L0_9PROT|nr:glycerophosphodiester phosphodiesterase family protein [Stella humosa]ROP84480.1 glycerophosphoryl diester phosphodiesterase [Stella humosa]BBK34000.1 glycerophosphoryl diester phosphodiesterase [Stella humosa]